jgi:hypothetical protein
MLKQAVDQMRMDMHNQIYDFMDSINLIIIQGFWPLLIVGIAAQIFIALKLKWYWGFLLPVITMIPTLYWMDNPIKEGTMPIMTSMSVILYWILAGPYFAAFLITKLAAFIVAERKRNRS